MGIKLKLNKIILLSIFLLAVLTLGAASASENSTDNLKIDGAVDVSASVDDDIVADDESGQPKDVEIVFPDSIKAYERFNVNITLPKDASGEVHYYFDANLEDDDYSYVYSGFNKVSSKIKEFGTHTLNINFISDDKEICNDKEVSKTYDVNDYVIDISIDEDEWKYGESNSITADLPSHTGKVVMDINGEKFNIDLDEEYEAWINYGPATTTNVTVKVTYKGDGKNIKAKSAEKVFAVVPKVYIPDEVIFKSSSDVVVNYADGEQIKFILVDYDDESSIYDEKTVTVKDSKAVYAIPDNLEFNKNYMVYVIHNNVTIVNEYFNVIPNMDLPNKFYSKRTYDIPVVFPEEYKNKNVTVSIGDVAVFKDKLDNTGKCDVHLSDLTPYEGSLSIGIYGDDGDCIYYYSREIGVSDVDPSCVNLNVDVPADVVKGSEIQLYFSLPYDIGGKIIAYVDGSEISRDNAYGTLTIYVGTDKLALGTHTLTLNYTGDGYFEPKVMSYEFNVSNYVVDIPDTLYYNNGDNILVKLQDGATGTVIIYSDGKKVKEYDVADIYDDYDEYSKFVRCQVDSLNLPLGYHNIRVYYKGNKAMIDVNKKINLDYTIPIYINEYIYGRENYVEFNLPDDSKGSVNVTIDGKPAKYRTTDDGYYYEVNVTEYFGDHVITVEYSGDEKYNHPLKVNETFSVAANIDYDSYVAYKSQNNDVSVVLPDDAKGNLVVEVDGEVYAKKAFENGKAAISFDTLNRGYYNVRVYYDGDDYYVENRTFDLSVNFNILVSSQEILFNESVDVYLNLPSFINGTLTVSCNGKESSAMMVDGYAKVTLLGLNLGENEYSANFVEDGEEPIEVSTEGTIWVKPIVIVSDNFVVFGKNIVSVLVPSGFKGKVSCYGDNDYERTAKITSQKTDVSMPLVTSGLYLIDVSVYDEDNCCVFQEGYQANVSKATTPKLFATSATVYNGCNYNAKVLGTDGNPLKGAKVTFQVGKNKAVAKKTNAKGIASLPMNYKPAKYTVVVKYAKQTLKVKVTVKKVLALKSVAVKKSAKKLVLTATLKKGKSPIKGKIVAFKFSGKTYNVKTNANGIAKVTIKSSVLKKLKVGKKITYQATYLKDTVKKTTKVKK